METSEYSFGALYKVETIWSDTQQKWTEVKTPFDTGAECIEDIQKKLADGEVLTAATLYFGLENSRWDKDYEYGEMPDWFTTLPFEEAANKLLSGHRQFLTEWWEHEGKNMYEGTLEEYMSQACTIELTTMNEDDPNDDGNLVRYFFIIIPNEYHLTHPPGKFGDLSWRDYGSNWEVANVDREITGPDSTCNPIQDPIYMTNPRIGDRWLHYKNTPVCMQKETATALKARGHTKHLNSFQLPEDTELTSNFVDMACK